MFLPAPPGLWTRTDGRWLTGPTNNRVLSELIDQPAKGHLPPAPAMRIGTGVFPDRPASTASCARRRWRLTVMFTSVAILPWPSTAPAIISRPTMLPGGTGAVGRHWAAA